MSRANQQFQNLLGRNATAPPPVLDVPLARRLLERTAHVPFFAHSYAMIHNLDHGAMTTGHLLDFAYIHELDGLCLHINDGAGSCVGDMSPAQLQAFRHRLVELGLALHLEISSTGREEVERATACALALGVTDIRLYARHEGRLSSVMERIYADLCHAAELANRHDLRFDYEQHEDLRSSEIAAVLDRVADPRIKALFDYTNSLNAYEEPLDALSNLAPHIRQVHIKGGRKLVEGDGWGQLGTAQGSELDELPGNRMLFELLMLGETEPQVTCFALEQEVGYYAPAFRRSVEEADPVIRYREPSQTPLDPGKSLQRLQLDEQRWAVQQVSHNRALVSDLRRICVERLGEPQEA